MSKILRVLVIGKAMTGKSTVMKLLSDFLKSKGFNTQEVWNIDGPPSAFSAELKAKNLVEKVNVVLAEFQEGQTVKEAHEDVHVRVEYCAGLGYSASVSVMGEKLRKDYADSASGQERARSVAARFAAELGVEVEDPTKTHFQWEQPR